MIKKFTLSALTVLALTFSAGVATAEEDSKIEDIDFSFEGPFGTYDQMQLQRGLQVYTESCAACHGLKFVPIRTLSDPGGPQLPVEQMRAYTAQLSVDDISSNLNLWDPETEELRALTPSDKFPANNSVNAPDLSLMTKARAAFRGPYGTGINQLFKGIGGPEYVVGILTGYTGEEKEEAGVTYYENHVFPGGWIAMPPPLYGDDVEYIDGSSTELEAEAEDIASFLTWTAEPKMMARKKMGFVAVSLLILLSSLLYLTNKRIWAPVKGKKTA
ncbi:cytochrome c1 [Candidatus Halocynthiibacter alkanivorans]|uniref:cytochrome c1 n=1 Tax=Candidatus Halocynthiibacter alkanivorans TaxID=2267619 RepID=UPI000DF47983|nr:cytochrome c1 [Candidatus Halocynthiibacter alkanivorans]